jgi:GT2 family glycosyltransferase
VTRASVAVVVLNWNGRDDTLACLGSVSSSDWPELTLIVVDNASDQEIASAVTERFPTAILIQNAHNLGFAGGMNVGLRRALELGVDYILLLNNDTTVERSMIRHLVHASVAAGDAGIVSPLVLSQTSRDMVMSAGWSFDARRGHPGRPVMSGQTADGRMRGVREVIASSGEAMLVSAATAREVGSLDETLYLRLEDIDWSLRMRARGRRNYVALDGRLWHAVSASSGGDHSPVSAYYHTRNMLVVCARHAPLSRTGTAIREAEVVVANVVHARRGNRPLENVRAAFAGWRDYRRGALGARSDG